ITLRFTAFDVVTFFTAIWSVVAWARSFAVTWIRMDVLVSNTVILGESFTSPTELLQKFVPETVIVVAPDPDAICDGSIAVTFGGSGSPIPPFFQPYTTSPTFNLQ